MLMLSHLNTESSVPLALYQSQQKVSSFQLQRNRNCPLFCREAGRDQWSRSAVLLDSHLVQLGFEKHSGSFSQQQDCGRFKCQLYYHYLYAWCKTFSFKYIFPSLEISPSISPGNNVSVLASSSWILATQRGCVMFPNKCSPQTEQI